MATTTNHSVTRTWLVFRLVGACAISLVLSLLILLRFEPSFTGPASPHVPFQSWLQLIAALSVSLAAVAFLLLQGLSAVSPQFARAFNTAIGMCLTGSIGAAIVLAVVRLFFFWLNGGMGPGM